MGTSSFLQNSYSWSASPNLKSNLSWTRCQMQLLNKATFSDLAPALLPMILVVEETVSNSSGLAAKLCGPKPIISVDCSLEICLWKEAGMLKFALRPESIELSYSFVARCLQAARFSLQILVSPNRNSFGVHIKFTLSSEN